MKNSADLGGHFEVLLILKRKELEEALVAARIVAVTLSTHAHKPLLIKTAVS